MWQKSYLKCNYFMFYLKYTYFREFKINLLIMTSYIGYEVNSFFLINATLIKPYSTYYNK